MLTRAGVFALFGGLVALFVSWSGNALPKAHAYHSDEELAELRAGNGLVGGQNNYFKGSGHCNGCHGHDPNSFSMITGEGVDVNVTDFAQQWASGAWPNYGMLMADTAFILVQDNRFRMTIFHSLELYDSPSQRPQLLLTYDAPNHVPAPVV